MNNRLLNTAKAGVTVLSFCTVFAYLSGCGGGDSTDPTTPPSAVETQPAVSNVSGWASMYTSDASSASAVKSVTGGEGAPASNIYVVTTRAELRSALTNPNSPTFASSPAAAALEPKIIYIKGTIYGTDAGNGKFTDEASYVASVPVKDKCSQWNFDKYLLSFDATYKANLATRSAASDTAATTELTLINNQGSARSSCANVQKAQIQFSIPSNTTLLGVGSDAKIIDGYLEINAKKNIIIRNLEIQAAQDRFMAWSPSDGATGNWNARYKGIAVVTGTRLWFDHLTLSDGAHPDSDEPVIFGKHIIRHDGLIDLEDGSDYVTISYSIFKNHDKTIMIGSGDGKGTGDAKTNFINGDRGKNHMTFFGNLFENSQERNPRVRFGQVHVYNNYFHSSVDDKAYPAISRTLGGGHYFIGMGIESMILSESNAFQYDGQGADEGIIVDNFKGYQFKDVGSWFNGKALDPTVINANAKSKYDTTKAQGITEFEAKKASAVAAGKTATDISAIASDYEWTTHEYTNELGWKPPYSYTPLKSEAAIRKHVLDNAGAGKLNIAP